MGRAPPSPPHPPSRSPPPTPAPLLPPPPPPPTRHNSHPFGSCYCMQSIRRISRGLSTGTPRIGARRSRPSSRTPPARLRPPPPDAAAPPPTPDWLLRRPAATPRVNPLHICLAALAPVFLTSWATRPLRRPHPNQQWRHSKGGAATVPGVAHRVGGNIRPVARIVLRAESRGSGVDSPRPPPTCIAPVLQYTPPVTLPPTYHLRTNPGKQDPPPPPTRRGASPPHPAPAAPPPPPTPLEPLRAAPDPPRTTPCVSCTPPPPLRP